MFQSLSYSDNIVTERHLITFIASLQICCLPVSLYSFFGIKNVLVIEKRRFLATLNGTREL